ncbi:autophagy protein 5 [Lunasporangiospora selenospora]|uniref:Autophagy protein 5 n=1 Tax=Lunasporangiospora selenospora TaxID=979761 RepID=A0A9P6FRG0_9FUNG|nr:autophagy protein 5 [Lunasporangiospora selenospora]
MAIGIAPYNPIAKVIWDGSIPILFSDNGVDLPAKSPNASLLIEAPRCSYLSQLTSRVLHHFCGPAHGPDEEAELWFDYNGIPLKWHYPIGLLYDIHGLQAATRSSSESPLPWKVTAHFRDFPADKLIRRQAVDSCQDYYMAMIKEADYLRNGSTKRIMNMSKADQMQLWDGLQSNNYDQFWSMNHKLLANEGTIAKSLPVRIYLPDNCPIIQEPVSPLDNDGQPRTLGQILHMAVPDLFPLDDGESPTAATALIHGVVPDLSASALWIAQNLSYPDTFLHIVIVLH